ncbi:MAG: metallophosphoesterase [Myxococcales bacterium]|nr:metallophosphoesterase [Myxococcales bacterium]
MAVRLAELLGGYVDIHGSGDVQPRQAHGLTAQAQDDAELVKISRRMHGWRDRWQRNAGRTLQELRTFFCDPDLSAQDAKAWIDTWVFACDHPAAFERAIAQEDGPSALAGPDALALSASGWFAELRAYLRVPPAVSREERVILDRLLTAHRWPDLAQLKAQHGVDLNPNNKQFEKLDPWWLGVADESLITKLGRWPNLEKFVAHSKDAPFVYQATAAEAAAPIALLADFGTGLYHSRMIARQLTRRAPAYAVHLGDVYYAGRQREFEQYYTAPLRDVVQKTKLFSLAENHELYSGGKWYLDFLRDPKKRGISPQQGSYFCLRFPRHQLIAIDVNWHKRQRFLHPASLQWLRDRLAEAGDRTTILLSGSGPYGYGSRTAYTLLSDLWDTVKSDRIAAWIWGDDHYCGLFDRDDLIAPFYGSCIGHGGYPAARQELGKPSWCKPLWVEDEPRFPRWTRLRQDVMNNGWCQLRLAPDGGFALTYLDWLGARRCHADFAVTDGRSQLRALSLFPRQQTAEQPPPLED